MLLSRRTGYTNNTLLLLLEGTNSSNVSKNEELVKIQVTDYGSKNKPKWSYIRHRDHDTLGD
jgi:hypothetical protein